MMMVDRLIDFIHSSAIVTAGQELDNSSDQLLNAWVIRFLFVEIAGTRSRMNSAFFCALFQEQIDFFLDRLDNKGVIIPGSQVYDGKSFWVISFIDQIRNIVLTVDGISTDCSGEEQ